jgi:hypothetical protein
MNVSEMIKEAIDKKEFKKIKDASLFLGISPELLRIILHQGHIPKDKTLGLIADKLGLNRAVLILTAHQEKVPVEVQGFFLIPTQMNLGRIKRKFPLNEEQCVYLAKIMNMEEIQLVRKYRQVSEEAKTQVVGYIDYLFASQKK